MKNRALIAVAAASLLSTSCVKEISSEERLERETSRAEIKGLASAEELAKVKCDDTSEPLRKARDENKPETDRIIAYTELFSSLKKRTVTFDEAMARNPDLAYQEGSQALVSARELCIQQTADVKVEFDRYVRELVDVPTVQEIKGGQTVIVARLDFGTLKTAIETLNTDDRDQLLNRVNNAEKKVEKKAPPGKK